LVRAAGKDEKPRFHGNLVGNPVARRLALGLNRSGDGRADPVARPAGKSKSPPRPGGEA
jgi:hypothetical protein